MATNGHAGAKRSCGRLGDGSRPEGLGADRRRIEPWDRQVVAAVILAAGQSRRMGSPKALLPLGNKSFLSHLVDVFASSQARPILVVLGHGAEQIRAEVSFGEARPLFNPRPHEGMLSSLRVGIRALRDAPVEAALVCPVDHPRITPTVVDRLIEQFEITHHPIVLPVHQGRRGHPVLFSRSLFAEILQASDAVGARQVVWDHSEEVLEVETDEEGIHVDVDTPEAYRKLLDSQ